jgi:GT2 family glycosyltransferase
VSAAWQRNYGARDVDTDLIAFVDDDVELPANLMDKLIAPFESPNGNRIGGVAGRIVGLEHVRPSPWVKGIYRLLAGYDDAHYGARLFGPAINTLPCYDQQHGLIRSEWLNSTCVVYRTELFHRELFPQFEGYSFLEDVHLSARIGKTHDLYFHSDATYVHHNAGSSFKRNKTEMAAMAMRNRRVVSREVMGISDWTIAWKQFIHRLLNTMALLKTRPEGWMREVEGTWKS